MTQRRPTTERGYGATHKALRAHWAAVILTQGADCTADRCLMSTRRIAKGTPAYLWDLGHDDGRKHRGPEHRRCNRAAGARHGAFIRRVVRRRVAAPVVGRAW